MKIAEGLALLFLLVHPLNSTIEEEEEEEEDSQPQLPPGEDCVLIIYL